MDWDGSNVCFEVFTVYHIKAQQNSKWNAGWYYPDYSPINEKVKLVNMCKELVADIKNKVHMTDAIRIKMEDDHKFLFHVGSTLGAIREQYKSQLEMFRQMRDRFISRNRLNTPEYRTGIVSAHFIIAMEEIYAKEVQIENHIHALMQVPAHVFDEQDPNAPNLDLLPDDFELPDDGSIPENVDKRPPSNISPPPGVTKPTVAPPTVATSATTTVTTTTTTTTPDPNAPQAGRSGDHADEIAPVMSEDELKRKMRAQYYQRHKN